jgi:hypothetical protein
MANYGKEKDTGKSLTFHPNVTLLGYYVCRTLIKKQGGKKKQRKLISETAYS